MLHVQVFQHFYSNERRDAALKAVSQLEILTHATLLGGLRHKRRIFTTCPDIAMLRSGSNEDNYPSSFFSMHGDRPCLIEGENASVDSPQGK